MKDIEKFVNEYIDALSKRIDELDTVCESLDEKANKVEAINKLLLMRERNTIKICVMVALAKYHKWEDTKNE